MEIDPALQFRLFLSAALWGVIMGCMREAFAAAAILLGAYRPPDFMEARYARPLPLIHRSVPFAPKGKGRRLWQGLVIAFFDCLFCVIFAIGLILILYAYNDGAVRLSVPALALMSFGAWQMLGNRLLRVPMAYFAYGFAAVTVYFGVLLGLPYRGIRFLALQFVIRPAAAAARRVSLRRLQARSAMLCQRQLLWASVGFTGECPKIKKNQKKGKDAKCQKNGKKEGPRRHNG